MVSLITLLRKLSSNMSAFSFLYCDLWLHIVWDNTCNIRTGNPIPQCSTEVHRCLQAKCITWMPPFLGDYLQRVCLFCFFWSFNLPSLSVVRILFQTSFAQSQSHPFSHTKCGERGVVGSVQMWCVRMCSITVVCMIHSSLLQFRASSRVVVIQIFNLVVLSKLAWVAYGRLRLFQMDCPFACH